MNMDEYYSDEAMESRLTKTTKEDPLEVFSDYIDSYVGYNSEFDIFERFQYLFGVLAGLQLGGVIITWELHGKFYDRIVKRKDVLLAVRQSIKKKLFKKTHVFDLTALEEGVWTSVNYRDEEQERGTYFTVKDLKESSYRITPVGLLPQQ
jgi:hypothetical protein